MVEFSMDDTPSTLPEVDLQREHQLLRVGDLVRYDPLMSYLLDNEDLHGKLGVVVDMSPSMMDIAVIVNDRRFWCGPEDLELVNEAR